MQRPAAAPRAARIEPNRLRWRLIAAGVLAMGLVGGIVALSAAGFSRSTGADALPPAIAEEPEALPQVAAPAPGPVPIREVPRPAARPARVIEGGLARAETLASALTAQGASPEVVHLIAAELAPHFDFRRARPGHTFRLAADDRGELLDFRYRTSITTSYRIVREGDRYRAWEEEVQLIARPVRMAGIVVSTLYRAVVDLGENGQLARDFAEVFAWDIDFQRSVQPGDRFQVLYERLYRSEDDGSESYVRPGRILAARYEGVAGLHTAVYFEPEQGRGGYYRPDGSSVQGQFLMAPLRHARVSSSYNSARRHPILKITRPHHGIDYAAPTGTPVWAVADGQVIYRARAGGFGNLVKIRHANGYVSYYAHLSRFAKGLAVGQQVGQKQVIGYVGSTGLSTGPHVCFRISKNGQYVNPARLRTPAGEPVPDSMRDSFRTASAILLAELDAGALVAAEDSL